MKKQGAGGGKSRQSRSPQAIFSNGSTNENLSKSVIEKARKTGKITLANSNLDRVPEKLFTIDRLDMGEVKKLEVDFDSDSSSYRWWDIVPLTHVDLSCNSIQTLPPEFKQLMELTHLTVQRNSIAVIADEIQELQNLKFFCIDHNKLTQFPKSFYSLTNLRVLSVSNNSLEIVDSDIGNLIMLTVLNLSHNALSYIPGNIGFLGRLTDLNVSHNNLKHVPIELTSICALKTLDLSNNSIEELSSLQFLEKLENLNLRCNKLKIFPDISKCIKLQVLDIAQNSIMEIDGSMLNDLKSLKLLYLNENKLESLPDEICNLSSLTSLDVSNNNLTELPPKLCALHRLRHLVVGENNFHSIPRHIIAAGTQRLLRFLKDTCPIELNSSSSNDDDFHPLRQTLEDMKTTRTLQFAGLENLRIVEKVVNDAVSVQTSVINMYNNKMASLPKNFHKLADYANEVDLSRNLLKELPSYFGNFVHIIFLTLGQNHLTSLPAELANCCCLRELNIENNDFTEIPGVVYDIVSLENLSAKGNKITSINVSGLEKLERLAVLDLSNNSISYVPPQLGNMTQLHVLQIHGNTFRVPTANVLEKNTREVLRYLRDRIPTP